jgi:hypothetical protein
VILIADGVAISARLLIVECPFVLRMASQRRTDTRLDLRGIVKTCGLGFLAAGDQPTRGVFGPS